MSTRRCELLLALDDNTWTTEVVEAPAQAVEDCDDGAIVAWSQTYLAPLTAYRNVVLFAVYNFTPEENHNDDAR